MPPATRDATSPMLVGFADDKREPWSDEGGSEQNWKPKECVPRPLTPRDGISDVPVCSACELAVLPGTRLGLVCGNCTNHDGLTPRDIPAMSPMRRRMINISTWPPLLAVRDDGSRPHRGRRSRVRGQRQEEGPGVELRERRRQAVCLNIQLLQSLFQRPLTSVDSATCAKWLAAALAFNHAILAGAAASTESVMWVGGSRRRALISTTSSCS